MHTLFIVKKNYLRNPLYCFGRKLWIIGVFLQFLQQCIGNVIFVIIVQLIHEIRITQNDFRRGPVSSAQKVATMWSKGNTEQFRSQRLFLQTRGRLIPDESDDFNNWNTAKLKL
jgi:hypothetical protein